MIDIKYALDYVIVAQKENISSSGKTRCSYKAYVGSFVSSNVLIIVIEPNAVQFGPKSCVT